MARRTIDTAVKTAVVAAALADGANLPEIAKQYGVSLPTVYNWKNAATRSTETVTPETTTVA
jgi:transposase-like protein